MPGIKPGRRTNGRRSLDDHRRVSHRAFLVRFALVGAGRHIELELIPTQCSRNFDRSLFNWEHEAAIHFCSTTRRMCALRRAVRQFPKQVRTDSGVHANRQGA